MMVKKMTVKVMKKTYRKKNKESIVSGSSSQDAEKIKERAYHIWEKKGKPANTALDDWLQAARESKKKVLI